MAEPDLKGIIPPLVTPFTPTEELDEDRLKGELRYLFEVGVDGVSFGGSTGEGASLSDDELGRGVQIVQEENKEGIPVLCGIIRNSTRGAVRAGLIAKDAGADALMVTPSHYFGAPEEGNYSFYETLAEKVGLPIIIYNVIQDNPISPQLVVKLSQIDRIVGIKQSCGGIHALTDMIAACGDKIRVFTAQDDLLYVSYLLGAIGAISAILTVFPELCLEQWRAVEDGDLELARRIHYRLLPVWRKIEGRAFPGKLKATLNLLGRNVGAARSPVLEPPPHQREAIEATLQEAGFL